MRTLAALLLLGSTALAQEPPPRPRPEPPELERRIRAVRQQLAEAREEDRERLEGELRRLEEELRRAHPPGRPPQESEARELQGRINDLRAALEPLPKDSPERARKEQELRRLEEEMSRLRPPRGPAQPPEPPGPPFPPGAERRRPVLNPEEIRAWLRENEPETYQRLMGLQARGARPEIMDILAGAEGRMHAMNEMKTRDPRGYERLVAMRNLEQETLELAERSRLAPPEERERIAAALKEKLSQLFDLRQEARERELEELRRRVGELEKALAGQRANKERHVENRRRILLGERPDGDR